ncbi:MULTISPECIES: carbon-phosphorus lyase complex subunit PhnI [unclassified Cupriavidus]|uniref:carbon-phosphorus lyase complex subunit PhnI n=1 Tax=unclassified Cupriavidus TaxID=2640874 RepID=UPI001C00494A|nr:MULTISPECIES: carbon-phosphorus lyase complex subunit PhnI [unclassified Cupriavidus]MCA3186297.1 carbon-phosphorus lyase complex subunit PhnI [Cupriavidus sp.]MCA3193073.1 carbon-phosphorus lyase complex subunit PhnI [Cupriavidus sp.]MCA3195925.1 carbon-phosphorus lyase complex subunit PhnI [Cupriavidus sp.]MCA3204826.1 carbon-phosphorus lyase complex subunit PhnI [Cupriavidus sp.]MCA3206979.1 carbon-phosphorus lyase complex subunit PhnI [Cupriavidus sp.]
MYVAVKGGERAILNSYQMLDTYRRGDTSVPELTLAQIREQMPLAVARVMAEGSLYDPHLAALAIKQAAGDQIEAIFLLRAYRTTLARFGYTHALDTGKMKLQRRISSTFKDVPGGQVLGPTYDYTQRLLDFTLEAGRDPAPLAPSTEPLASNMPRVTGLLEAESLVEADAIPAGDPAPPDLTREPLTFPADRPARLQNLARADEGFLLSMGYSTQRGYGNSHPFAAEIRYGSTEVEMFIEELGFAVTIGEVELTECQMVSQFAGNADEAPRLTRGYGLTFGYNERKAMSMALVDRAMRAEELGEAADNPANDIEFMLYHSDNVEASGFVQHLKLPHYVDFQANLELLRRLRAEQDAQTAPDAANNASTGAPQPSPSQEESLA